MVEQIGGYNTDSTNPTVALKATTVTELAATTKVAHDVIMYKSDGTVVTFIKQLVTTTTALSGSTGATGRILTLTNTTTTEGPVSVIMGNTPLIETTDFTVSHLAASSTITFVNAVFNGQTLEVHYYA